MKINNMYGNAKQGMDDKFHVQRNFTILQEVSSRWISQTNHHLLIWMGMVHT
jgi:hypothetical protein